MPPWFADPQYGKFANDASLSQRDIKTLVSWSTPALRWAIPRTCPRPGISWRLDDSQARHHFPIAKALPGAADRSDGISVRDHSPGFTKDTWVEQVQAAPTNYSVVHHIVAYVRTPGSNYFKDMPKNEFFEAPPSKTDGTKARRTTCRTIGSPVTRPASRPTCSSPARRSSFSRLGHRDRDPLRAGGKATTDQSRLGLVLAKALPVERAMTLSAAIRASRFRPATRTFAWMRPTPSRGRDAARPASAHAMRGKSAQYRLVFADGKRETSWTCRASPGIGSSGTTSPNPSNCPRARSSSAPSTSTTRRITRRIRTLLKR